MKVMGLNPGYLLKSFLLFLSLTYCMLQHRFRRIMAINYFYILFSLIVLCDPRPRRLFKQGHKAQANTSHSYKLHKLATCVPCTVGQVWAVDATLLLSKKWPWSAGKQQLFANEVHSEHPSCPCTKKISQFEAQSARSFASYRRSTLTCRSPPSNNNVTTVYYLLIY
jgi:hypothetical protein